MAKRDVELVVRLKDQASALANQIDESFKKLSSSAENLGKESTEAGQDLTLLTRLLKELQTNAGGLSAFSKIARDVDTAGATIKRMQAELQRTEASFQQFVQGAAAATSTLNAVEGSVQKVNRALNENRAQLAAEKGALAQTNAEIAKASERYRNLITAFKQAEAPSEALRNSIRDQQTTLLQLSATQERQRNTVTATAAKTKELQTAYSGLNAELKTAETAVRRATVDMEKSAVATEAARVAITTESAAFSELQAVASRTGAALGGVAASEEAITAASRNTAATIERVTAAMREQASVQRAAASPGAGALAGAGGQVSASAQATAAFRAQADAVKAASIAHAEATAEVQRLALAVKAAAAPTAELNAQFELARRAADQAKTAYQAQQKSLADLRKAISDNASARKAAADAEIAEQARIKSAGAALRNDLINDAAKRTQAQEAYNKSLLGTVRNLLGLKSPAEQAAAALNRVQQAAQRASGQGELSDRARFQRAQVLAFQVNDIVTQLASGTSLARTLGQQAGQIAQLSPTLNNVIVQLVRMLPLVALIGIALAPFVNAVIKLGEQKAALREFNDILAGTGSALGTSSQALTESALAIDKYAGSLKDAKEIVKTFLTEGIDPSQFERLGNAAGNVAKVLGVEAPEAAKQLSQALKGSAQDVLNLDNKLNFLTATERNMIIAMELTENGTNKLANSQRQAAIVADAFARRGDAIAANARGGWASAFKEFGRAFDDVSNAILNSGLFKYLADGFSQVGDQIAGAIKNFRVGVAFFSNGFNGQEAVDSVRRSQGGGAGGQALSPKELARQQEELAIAQVKANRALEQSNAQRQLEINLVGKSKGAAAAAREELKLRQQMANSTVVFTEDQIKRAKNLAAAEATATDARRKGASEAESLAKRQRTFNLSIEAENNARRNNIELLGMTQRQQAIKSASDAAENRALQARVTFTAAQRTEVERLAAAEFDARSARQNENDILSMQIQLRELLNQKISVQQQIEEEAQLANRDLSTEQGKKWADQRRQVIETTNALDALKKKQEELAGLTAQLREGERDIRQARQEGESLEVLRARREELEKIAIKTKEIQAEAIKMAEALGQDEVVEKLKGANVELRIMKDEVLSVAQANTMISQGLTSATLEATDAIGAAIEGTTSWGDAIRNVGDAFRKFAGDFLRQIAQMIIQALILRAIQASGAGGFFSKVSNGLGLASVKHGGGRVGAGGHKRRVDPRVFANARRFHNGTAPGLNVGERAAILKDNEVVLTEAQQRAQNQRTNGGGVKVVNLFDSGSFVSEGLNTSEGQKALMNFVRSNPRAINGALGK